ncbi:MAG: NFACT RNA binding domain-containing protein [Chlamydiota bacterium]
MNMKYLELKEVIAECREELKNSTVNKVTQHTPRCLIIHFQRESKKKKLLISLQTPFVRVHLTDHEGEAPVVPFMSHLNKEITRYIVKDLKLIQHDRILKITLQHNENKRVIISEFFSKSPNCYFIDALDKVYFSLFKTLKETYTPPEEQNLPPPPVITGTVSSHSIEKRYDILESKARFEKEKTQVRKIIYRRFKKSQRTTQELSAKLEECQKWQEVHHQAELLQANLYQVKRGMKQIDVDDWITGQKYTIELDPSLSPNKQVDLLFQRAKKLKKGIGHLLRQIEEKKAELSHLKHQLEEISPICEHRELNVFCERHGLSIVQTETQKKKEKKPRLPFIRYLSSHGEEILVGKRDKDNDTLTFHHANGSDWWLHVSERPGSHVIIKTHKGTEPDSQTLLEACQLAIANSKAKGDKGAEIVITQQKYLKRKKGGRPGTVFLSKHQKRWVDFDPTIIKRLQRWE